MKPLRLVFAAGGTAGHIEPALNVADAITAMQPDTFISFLGSERGLETTLVPARGYPLHTVTAVPFPRKPNLAALTFPSKLWRATRQAKAYVQGADAVIGFGGYPAVPGYIAAHRLGIPCIIHEANAKAGLANRLAARWTTHQYASHPAVLPGSIRCALPIRASIATLDRATARDAAQRELGVQGPTVLVFGGSQGARHLNAVLTDALPELLAAGVNVLHAYGSKNQAPSAQPGYRPLAYIDEMAQAYAAADLVVARAGAMTCAEVTAIGMPTIFVPLPIGNGEQRLNAEPIVEAGGAIMIDDAALTPTWLVEHVTWLLADPARLAAMSTAAASIGAPESTSRLAADILAIANRRNDA
jgi:UDP-N-acetylglucosamine--N-acetylmuramyl-(pentapeptide) pyrophosphoryl-undecaprenol N-acetylglucosamine transferase